MHAGPFVRPLVQQITVLCKILALLKYYFLVSATFEAR